MMRSSHQRYSIKKLFLKILQYLQKNTCVEVSFSCKYCEVLSICKRLLLEHHQDHRARSSRPGVFCKKGVLRNFAKFTGKHLCWSLFFNKVPRLRPATLLKKALAQVFSCEFLEISKNTFSYGTPQVAGSSEYHQRHI